MLVDKQSELMSDLLFTVHQHGGDDVTWKPPIGTWTEDDDDGSVNVGKKMNLRSFKLNRVFGPAQYVKMQATFPEVEFLRILFRFKKRKENSSSYVHVLYKTSN